MFFLHACQVYPDWPEESQAGLDAGSPEKWPGLDAGKSNVPSNTCAAVFIKNLLSGQ